MRYTVTTFRVRLEVCDLAASTVGIADHFPEALASRFAASLDPIRPLIAAGFEDVPE